MRSLCTSDDSRQPSFLTQPSVQSLESSSSLEAFRKTEGLTGRRTLPVELSLRLIHEILLQLLLLEVALLLKSLLLPMQLKGLSRRRGIRRSIRSSLTQQRTKKQSFSFGHT